MYTTTTPFNNPPIFCEEHGKALQEGIYNEDTEYDIYTGQKVSLGEQTKIRWCPIYYPLHKYTSWSLKEGDSNWTRKLIR